MAINFLNNAIGTSATFTGTITVQGTGDSSFVGNVGIGTSGTNPADKLHVMGTVRSVVAAGNGFGFLTNRGTENSACGIRWDNNNSSLILKDSSEVLTTQIRSSGFSYLNGGNVGIGTSSPDSKLHVESTSSTGANFILESTHSGGIPLLDLKGAASAQLRYKDELNVIQGRIDFGDSGTFNFIDVPNNKSTLYLETGGNVGIGTASPDHILCIEDTEPTLRIFDSANTLNQEQTISFGTEPGNRTHAEISGINLNAGNSAGGLIFKTNTGSSLIERMRISSAGAIKFNAYGAGTLVTDASGNITAVGGGGAGGPFLPLSAGSGFPLTGALHTDGTIFMSAANPGIIMQETDVTDKNWDIQVNGGNLKVYEVNDARSVFSEKVTFKAGGNVGIGETNPSAKLHIKDAIGTEVTLLQLESSYNNPSGNKSIAWSDATNDIGRISVDYSAPMSKMRFGSLYNSGYQTSDLIVIQGNGNVGIGTDSPDATLEVQTGTNAGKVRLSSDGNGPIFSGNGDLQFYTNNVAYSTKFYSANKASTLATILDGGNVGIGTTTPDSLLEISKAQASGPILKLTNPTLQNGTVEGGTAQDFGQLGFVSGDSSTGQVNLIRAGIKGIPGETAYSTGGELQFQTMQTYAGTAPLTALLTRMVINAEGDVGIGTTSPSAKLEVKGAATSGNYAAYIQNASGGGNVLKLYNHDWDISDYLIHATNGGTASNGYAFVVNGNGNVGIGTTSPDRRLVLDGTLGTAALEIKKNTDRIVYLGTGSSASADDNTILHLMDQNVVKINLNTVGDSYLNGGDVGIGTSSPAARLDVHNINGGNATTRAEMKAEAVLKLRPHATNSTNMLFSQVNNGAGMGITVTNGSATANWDIALNPYGGNVGIGTASPNNPLHIVGNTAKLQGSGSGYTAWFITNSGTGNAGTYYDAINGDTAGGDYGFIGQNNSGYMSYDIGASSPMPYHVFTGGNVGIGTTNPSAKLHVLGTDIKLQQQGVAGDTTLGFYAGNNGSINADVNYANINTVVSSGSTGFESGYMTFETKNSGTLAERMRITSAGDVLIGTQGIPNGTSIYGAAFGPAVSGVKPLYFGTSSTSAKAAIIFSNPNGIVGDIRTSGTGTSYLTSSDYRLKEDLQDFAGLDMVSKIPVYDYKWKADESRSYGVMAHELQEVLPDAVSGEKDAEEMQGVDYSKIVPLLIKSIQELTAKVERLEANK